MTFSNNLDGELKQDPVTLYPVTHEVGSRYGTSSIKLPVFCYIFLVLSHISKDCHNVQKCERIMSRERAKPYRVSNFDISFSLSKETVNF